MRKIALLACIAATTIFYACQQEVPDIISQVQQCRIDSGFYDDNQSVSSFHYSASGKLEKVTDMDGYWLYTYNGDRIATRHYFDTLFNATLYIDSVFYDASGRVSELRRLDLTGFIVDTLSERYVYQYQNNQLNRLLYIDVWNNGAGFVHDTFPVHIHWSAAGNIDKMVYYDNFGDIVDSIHYLYDSHPNYFKMIHPHIYLFDPRIRIHYGIEANFPYFYSKNNVVNSNIYGTFDNDVTYGLDSVNRIGRIEMGGIEYARYKYKCP